MDEPKLTPEEKQPNRFAAWAKRNKKPLNLFVGLLVVAFVMHTFCGTKGPTKATQTQQSINRQAQQVSAEQIRHLQEELQAERDKNAQLRSSNSGRRIAKCTIAQAGQVRQDQYGGQLVCTQETDGYWWEQFDTPQLQNPSLTTAQLAHIQAQGAQNTPGIQNTAATPQGGATNAVERKPKAPDFVVSFRQESPEQPPAPAPRTQEQPATTQTASAASQPVIEKASGTSTPATKKEDPALTTAIGPKYRVREGTLLPCTEFLRINGAFNGHINCLISVPVYSTSGNHLLIPQYSLALGHVHAVSDTHQERLFVAFDKIIMPDGYTKEIDDSDGLDQIGQNGLKDKTDRHLMRIFGTSLAIASIGGLAQIGNGNVVTPFAEYRAGVTESVSQSSMQVLDSMLDTTPTMIIREGARNQIRVNRDFYLEDFYNHRMKGDM